MFIIITMSLPPSPAGLRVFSKNDIPFTSSFLDHDDLVRNIPYRGELIEQLIDRHELRHTLGQAVLFFETEARQELHKLVRQASG